MNILTIMNPIHIMSRSIVDKLLNRAAKDVLTTTSVKPNLDFLWMLILS